METRNVFAQAFLNVMKAVLFAVFFYGVIVGCASSCATPGSNSQNQWAKLRDKFLADHLKYTLPYRWKVMPEDKMPVGSLGVLLDHPRMDAQIALTFDIYEKDESEEGRQESFHDFVSKMKVRFMTMGDLAEENDEADGQSASFSVKGRYEDFAGREGRIFIKRIPDEPEFFFFAFGNWADKDAAQARADFDFIVKNLRLK